MPDGSVTVTANWSRDGGSSSSGRDDSDPSYAVGIPDKMENGSVSVSPKNASQGDRVTVTVKPDAGYELDSLKVFDKNGKELELTDKGDGKFTFIMPAGKVEVKATFTEGSEDQPLPGRSHRRVLLRSREMGPEEGHHRRHRRRPCLALISPAPVPRSSPSCGGRRGLLW